MSGEYISYEEVIKMAIDAEKRLDFSKAIELYRSVRNELSVKDGSLVRYVNLLMEFEDFAQAKELLESLILKEKYYTKWSLGTLALVYERLGDTEKALVIYKKLGNEQKVKQIESSLELRKPKRIYIDKFISLFSGREDVFSIQTPEGYYPVRRPLSVKDVIEHFSGKKTLGIYVLRSDDTVKFAAVDVDVKKGISEDDEVVLNSCKNVAKEVYKKILSENLNAYIEYSGKKGYHIWLFFDMPVAAYKVRYVLRKIVEKIDVPEDIHLEVFPKQDKLNGGLGNLIKVPLGKHAKTGKWCVFLDENFRVVNAQHDFLLKINVNNSSIIDELFKEYFDDTGEVGNIDQDDIAPSEIRIGKRISKQPSSNVDNARHTVIEEKSENSEGKSNLNMLESSKVLKKVLRNEIRSKMNEPVVETLRNSCFIFSQMVAKVQAIAHISKEEERILAGILNHIPNGFEIAKSILGKTIDYSEEKVRNLFDSVGTIPITCEEIKTMVYNFGLMLDLSRCTCRFSQMMNTPVNYVKSDGDYIEKFDSEDIAKRLVEKTREKLELEIEIRRLKEILKKKLSSGSTIDFDGARISVLDSGEIRVEFF
ncbi:CRISPR-associated primase-polymerase type A1 [Fervidobacterium sp.]